MAAHRPNGTSGKPAGASPALRRGAATECRALSTLAAFENRRDPLATTDTHGLQPVACVTPLHFVQECGEDTSPRRRYGMTEGNARAIHVQLVPTVQLPFLEHGQHL